jgi:hypothetical protein
MNLRWQPKYHRAEATPFTPFVASEPVDTEEVTAAREA